MAVSASGADFADDDEFDEYNPHPYKGGYDVAATYGSPIPPSSATCYPVSSPAPTPAPPPPPAPPSPVAAEPAAGERYWPEPYDYGEAPRPEPYHRDPEVFRSWPYSRGSDEYDYWRPLMRGLDYLFCHSDGYGERRIGTDSYGIPIYASKKSGEEAVVVEVAPPAVGRIGFHGAGDEETTVESNQLAWYSEGREEAYAYDHPTFDSYDKYSYDQSFSLHHDWDDTVWLPKVNYQEVHQEESRYTESLSYDERSKLFCKPVYSYNQHFCEQPLNFQVEPVESVCSQRLEYYENFSSCDEPREGHIFEISNHPYEMQSSNLEVSYAPLQPFKPSWSQNLGYCQACLEGETPESHNHSPLFGEQGDIGSLFFTSYYPQEMQVYKEPDGDELDPFKQTWHDQINWNMFAQDVSETFKSGDDSYHINGSFWPFEEYPGYNE